jgi:hypothetical protein
MGRFSSWSAKRRWRFDIAALIVIVVGTAVGIGRTVVANVGEAESVSEWTVLGHWAIQNTPSKAVFLIPTPQLFYVPEPLPATDVAFGATVFGYEAHRQIWVTFKQADAVMWKPSLYRTWLRRASEVIVLQSLDDKLAYARANAIDYVIETCSSKEDGRIIFKTEHFCVYKSS